MKKGFTLIELLAVIVMLSILVLLVFPKITDIVRNKQTDVDETMDTMIYSAINLYVSNNSSQFEKTEGYGYCVSINELVSKGYLQSPVKLYNSNEDITDTKGVQVKYRNGFNYELKNMDECTNYIPYKDNSGANVPELMDSLVPVIYNEDHWEIADITKEWYDYDNQEWANAVILSDAGKSKTLEDTLDLEKDVLAMFVWIPRYSYTISSEAKGDADSKGKYPNPRAIDIKFVDVNTKDTGSAEYTNSIGDTWYTHPAFTFGEELSGIWVGKFETSAKAGSNCYTNASEANCNNTIQEPYILPNVPSLRYQSVNNQFETAKKVSNYINNSGDSHMAKNSEWVAVAYLTQSKYGKYGNSDYTDSNKEVYQNKSITFITGNSNGTPGTDTTNTQCSYDNLDSLGTGKGSCGGGASTTGNITGVYDMSGGAWDRVMGVYTQEDSSNEFNPLPDIKYYDNYTTSSFATACNGGACTGHALGETNGWYGDYVSFVSATNPWLFRGGYYGSTPYAGVFYSGSSGSNSRSTYSFRVVLSQTT